jgi:hypothetical protein
MMYNILDEAGEIVNTIIADEAFVEANYFGRYILVGLEPQPVLQLNPVITKAAFRFRLTDAEYAGILTAAKTDVEVQAWVETFNMVTQIDLDNQRTIDGVGTLVVKGLLTQARADEILTTSVNDAERP